jgi:hypothetical protein
MKNIQHVALVYNNPSLQRYLQDNVLPEVRELRLPAETFVRAFV